MKKLIIISSALLFLLWQSASAQPKIQEILQRLPDRSIPYQGEKHDYRDKGATGVYRGYSNLIDRLYTNVQLTEWRDACDNPAEFPTSCHDFILPGHDIHLLAISFGGVTDWRTDVLLSVTPVGEILDQMPVAVMEMRAAGISPVMQYEITSDAKIIVYRLEPVSDVSIPLSDFTSFTAQRVDRTYEVDQNGKFVLVNTVRYRPRTYTREMLCDENYNIYLGNEMPMKKLVSVGRGR